ncbi:MAG: hypothetical protein ACI9SD_001551 [Pseudohongiellaceae bacterium]|jgi:hypothetical protein
MLSKFSESLIIKILNYSRSHVVYTLQITVIIIKLSWVSFNNLLFFSIASRQSRYPSEPVLKTGVLLMFYLRKTRQFYNRTY